VGGGNVNDAHLKAKCQCESLSFALFNHLNLLPCEASGTKRDYPVEIRSDSVLRNQKRYIHAKVLHKECEMFREP
jgi:hypothetical protein